MVRVFVADNHPIVHKGIKAIFRNSSEIDIVGKGLHFRDLIDYLDTEKTCVVLLELSLPGLEDIRVIKSLRDKYPHARFLIYSSYKEEIYAINTLKSGASGYMCKTNSTIDLREAILKVSSGGVFITKELAEHIAFSESGNNPLSVIENLSEREVQVLRFLVSGKKNKEISFALNINPKTVSTYRTRLMKKLKVKNLVEMIRKTEHIDLDYY